jgi:protein TonB
MITALPTHHAVNFTAPAAVRVAPPPIADGSWRYDSRRRSRPLVITSVLVSVGIHVAILFGIGKPTARKAVAPPEENLIALVPMPQLKELEEPEPAPTDDTGAAPDLSLPVPMQADVPQLARPTDFVQAINYASLLEQPDFSQLKVYVIPENIRTGTGKIAEKIGKIFNLADLDRIPEPILQAAPIYPVAMRRESLTATVRVEFIVDTEGRVVNPVVVHTTVSGFEDAALAGVAKWRFRPGWKGGRKVNTRMAVPIVFTFTD